jgi:hypothetical protein
MRLQIKAKMVELDGLKKFKEIKAIESKVRLGVRLSKRKNSRRMLSI